MGTSGKNDKSLQILDPKWSCPFELTAYQNFKKKDHHLAYSQSRVGPIQKIYYINNVWALDFFTPLSAHCQFQIKACDYAFSTLGTSINNVWFLVGRYYCQNQTPYSKIGSLY